MLRAFHTNLVAMTSGQVTNFCAIRALASGQEFRDRTSINVLRVRHDRFQFYGQLPLLSPVACAGWTAAAVGSAGPTLVAKALVGVARPVGASAVTGLAMLCATAAAPVGFGAGLFEERGPVAGAWQSFCTVRSCAAEACYAVGAVVCGIAIGCGEAAAALGAALAWTVTAPVVVWAALLSAGPAALSFIAVYFACDRANFYAQRERHAEAQFA